MTSTFAQRLEKAKKETGFSKRLDIGDGKSHNVHMVSPWDWGVALFAHDKFGEGGFFHICHLHSGIDGKAIKGMENVPCPYCAMDNQEKIDQKIKSRTFIYHDLWDASANDGGGVLVLLEFPWNNFGPYPALEDVLNGYREENQKADITDFSIRLTQQGTAQKKSFNAAARQKLVDNLPDDLVVRLPSALAKAVVASKTNGDELLKNVAFQAYILSLDEGIPPLSPKAAVKTVSKPATFGKKAPENGAAVSSGDLKKLPLDDDED